MSDLQERLNRGLTGRYIVERQLGEGGMAVVFLARDLRHDRPVALKVRTGRSRIQHAKDGTRQLIERADQEKDRAVKCIPTKSWSRIG